MSWIFFNSLMFTKDELLLSNLKISQMSEKVNLIKLSSKSWHYKLIKFVFGNSMPDPREMRNLCPYFWILIASLFLVVFVGTLKFIGFCIRQFVNAGNYISEKISNNKFAKWIKTVSTVDMAGIAESDYVAVRKLPKYVKEKSYYTIFSEWAKTKGFDISDPEQMEMAKALLKSVEEERNRKNEAIHKWKREMEEKSRMRQLKSEEREERIRRGMDSIANIFKPIKKTFTINFSTYTGVVKATKRFVGLLVTTIIAAALFFLVQWTALLAAIIVKNWNGPVIIEYLEYAGLFIAFVAAVIGAIFVIYKICDYAITYYKENDKIVWWLWPVVGVAMVVFYAGKFLIYYPGYFIFVSFLWKFFMVGILWGILRGFGKGFVKAGGIFGEYFGASYSDYCPGIEWDNENK